jgi:hypothetical protein
MSTKVVELEATLEKASSFVIDLSAYISSLPTQQGLTMGQGGMVPMEEFLAFKEAHAQSLASIQQDLKGGSIDIGGITFEGKDSCVAFAWVYMTNERTYHCIPSL